MLSTRHQNLLAKWPIIAAMSPASAEQFINAISIVEKEPKEEIFKSGERAECFYLVLKGYVRAFSPGKDGRETDIAVSGPGETLGACTVFNAKHYLFSAQAAEHTTLAQLQIDWVHQLAKDNSEIALSLLDLISANLQQMVYRVIDDRTHTAPQRLAQFLLKNCGEETENVRFRLPFQKSLLAGKLGLAPEALSRAFSTLRSVGVSVHGRVIEISDVDALRKL